MAIATITSKGQLTIPKSVRDRLHLRAGDRVVFHIEADGSVRLYPISKKVSEVFGFFSSKGQKRHSASQIKHGLRKAFREGRL
ncbi:MAG TPA: AbrB/MazE/SpoVT family DNA-binding domain-containing protein [Vicinamibacteria bacterium]|nr:AbrB/MazE/SpoVT family DNA-binding domain-containing protein [Vicinamibacteria bacterium]